MNKTILFRVEFYIPLCAILIFFRGVFADTKQSRSSGKVVYTAGKYFDPFSDWLPREIKENPVVIKQRHRAKRQPAENIILPNFSLEGIVWGGGFPQVIIDGLVLKEGEKIEGAEVLEITKSKVKMLYKNKIFFLMNNSGIRDTKERRR
ncbi:MAG: hypothetical protein ACE5GG_00920 [Candidatus Omnitrophota bacterium]